MSKNYVETLVGFLVLFTATAFAYNAYYGAELGKNDDSESYSLNIAFDRIDGLGVGSDVKVSGLKVGTVTKAFLDPGTYQAKVDVSIDNAVKLPDDSSAEIISAGLLGDKYIALVPGGSDKSFENGDKIKYSQSSISIEALIGKFVFGSNDKEKEDKKEKNKSSDW